MTLPICFGEDSIHVIEVGDAPFLQTAQHLGTHLDLVIDLASVVPRNAAPRRDLLLQQVGIHVSRELEFVFNGVPTERLDEGE